MRIIKHLLTFIFSMILAVGCSSLSSHHSDSNTEGATNSEGLVIEKLEFFDFEAPVQISSDQVFDSEEERLAQKVEQALASGEQAINYLSGELYLKASDASMRQDSQKAALLLKHLLALTPGQDLVLRKYAVELIRLGRLAEAEEIVVEIYESVDREDENIALILGGIYTALDQTDQARDIYNEVLVMNPSNREACIFLSKSYAISENYERSDDILSSCYESSNRDRARAVFAYYRGTLAVEKEQTEMAISHFESALENDHSFFQAVMALGMTYEEQERWDEAVEAYQSYLVRDGLNRSVLSQLVQVLFASGRYEEVLPYAQRLIRLDPSNLNLKVRVGIIYSDLDKFSEAIAVFEQVLEEAPNADKVLYYVGALYQQKGQYDRAISYYSRIPENSSLFHEGAIQIGEMLGHMAHDEFEAAQGREPAEEGLDYGIDLSEFDGSPLKALEAFVEAHYDGSPSVLNIELHVILANFYESIHDYAQAAQKLENVAELDNFTVHHDYYLAALFEKAGESEKATSIIRDILAEDPDHAHALNFLGYTMIERGENLSEAYRLIKRAIELEPEDGYIRDSLGWYYYKKGELEKALVEVKKAQSLLDKEDMVITKHLAIIYKEMKEYQKAEQFYQEALKLCQADYEREKLHEIFKDLESLRVPASSVSSHSHDE